ncbi:MAG: NADH-quinone oxidoreductase subunit, partial [Actinomycetota bacterium]|nr:NADH-quinone oxidoreductase subunit [Actinomycetota bacterium]
MPLLRLAQERDGWVTPEAMAEIGDILGLSSAEVLAVASFYSMYHLKPKGRHVISVCHNLACNLMGAERVIE